MARAKKDPFGRETLATETVAEDVKVRISQMTVEGEDLIEIREWSPSSQTFGRGITLPEAVFYQLIDQVNTHNMDHGQPYWVLSE